MKKKFVKIFLGQKNFFVKKFFSEKKIWSNIIPGHKNSGQNSFWSKKIFGQENILVKKKKFG